jgi:hypothetical protein
MQRKLFHHAPGRVAGYIEDLDEANSSHSPKAILIESTGSLMARTVAQGQAPSEMVPLLTRRPGGVMGAAGLFYSMDQRSPLEL